MGPAAGLPAVHPDGSRLPMLVRRTAAWVAGQRAAVGAPAPTGTGPVPGRGPGLRRRIRRAIGASQNLSAGVLPGARVMSLPHAVQHARAPGRGRLPTRALRASRPRLEPGPGLVRLLVRAGRCRHPRPRNSGLALRHIQWHNGRLESVSDPIPSQDLAGINGQLIFRFTFFLQSVRTPYGRTRRALWSPSEGVGLLQRNPLTRDNILFP